jgi:hypothetical protein
MNSWGTPFKPSDELGIVCYKKIWIILLENIYYNYELQWNLSKPASTGTKKIGRFCETSFARNIVEQGLKKSADIQGGPVFWGSGLEKFHCIQDGKVYVFNMSRYTLSRIHVSINEHVQQQSEYRNLKGVEERKKKLGLGDENFIS